MPKLQRSTHFAVATTFSALVFTPGVELISRLNFSSLRTMKCQRCCFSVELGVFWHVKRVCLVATSSVARLTFTNSKTLVGWSMLRPTVPRVTFDLPECKELKNKNKIKNKNEKFKQKDKYINKTKKSKKKLKQEQKNFQKQNHMKEKKKEKEASKGTPRDGSNIFCKKKKVAGKI